MAFYTISALRVIQISGDLRFSVVVFAEVCSAIQRDVLCHPRNPHALGRQAGARRMLESTSNGTHHTCAQAVEFQPENSTRDKLRGKKKYPENFKQAHTISPKMQLLGGLLGMSAS